MKPSIMSERPHRIFNNINFTGQEGQILANERVGIPGKWVVRTMDKKFPRGIDKTGAEQLRSRYRQLKAEFGELIPNQRIIKATDKIHYIVAQERLTLATPADIFNYLPSDVPAKIRVDLKSLVDKLREDYTAYLHQKNEYDNSQHPALDLGPGNLLVTADEHVRFVDTGLLATSYAEYYINDALLYEVDCRLAQLDLLSGRSPFEVFNDGMYSNLMEVMEEMNDIALTHGLYDATTMKVLFDDVFVKSPLRKYLDPDRE